MSRAVGGELKTEPARRVNPQKSRGDTDVETETSITGAYRAFYLLISECFIYKIHIYQALKAPD
jgi:hypothetical protein